MFKRLRNHRAARSEAGGTTSSPGTGLQVCDRCHADYVCPVEWRESDNDRWWMRLRCGECRSEREVTVTNEIAKRFGADLDASQREIERAVRLLDEERMADEIEAFALALQRDLIDAGDFTPRSR